ncbi:MAG: sulfatase-like hydrolase/transferase, partial [Byssovorax sp.]
MSTRRAVAPSAPRKAAPRAPAPPRAPHGAAGPSSGDARPLLAGMPVGWRIADAYLAMALLAYAELYAVALIFFAQLAGAFELSLAWRCLMPVALAAAAPCAVIAGIVVELCRRGEGRAGRAGVTLAAALFAGAVGYGVAGGRHFEGGLRVPFAAGLAVVAGALAFLLAPRVGRALARPFDRGRALLVAGVAIAAVIVLEIASARILPRLYPAFHLGLGALALLAAAFATLGLAAIDRPEEPRPRGKILSFQLARGAAALVLFALGAALSQGAARKLSRLDNLRILYLERAPLLGNIVTLAAELAPPAPLDDAAPIGEKTSGTSIDLSGRDILLITTDALRADHVGAYGYGRPITPNLDRLAKTGVVFDAAYSPTPHTSYAVTSIMTGKYMRPLVLQGLGDDSETWAGHLRRYGYRTAAFYPPAVFFIDAERFGAFRDRALDFEYRKVEFAPAALRAAQVKAYLDRVKPDRRVFLWVHLFEPHEPYEAHPEHPLGDRDIDRYD